MVLLGNSYRYLLPSSSSTKTQEASRSISGGAFFPTFPKQIARNASSSLSQTIEATTLGGNSTKDSSPKLEYSLILTSHTFPDSNQPHIIELTLPKDWQDNSLLHIQDNANGFCFLQHADASFIIMDSDSATEPLLVIEHEPCLKNYSIQAIEKLTVAGKRTVLGRETLVKARKTAIKHPQKIPPIQTCESNALDNYALIWEEAPNQPNIKTINGDLRVNPNEKLDAGTYYVNGNIRFYGGAFGPITLIAKGNVILRPNNQQLHPAQSNVLLISRGCIVIIGNNCNYQGNICSLDSDITIQGRQQAFQNGSLSAQNIIIKGTGNAFLPGRTE